MQSSKDNPKPNPVLTKKDFIKITDFSWEIPKTARKGMNVPARFYASEQMLDQIFKDHAIEQLINVAMLPGVEYAMAMPDVHEGYGFPVGGVAATRFPDGVISPGGIGYDINCGVRLLKSSRTESEIKPFLEELTLQLYNNIPSGVGKGGEFALNEQELNRVLKKGLKWALEKGYATEEDLENTESNGCIEEADHRSVSKKAKERGFSQLGTIGSGNHFVEIGKVDKVYDSEIADEFGLSEGQITVLIHSGSRGLGHQVATDYIHVMMEAMPRYGISIPDRELSCAPLSSPEGRDYFQAMSAAANYAWVNRQMIAHEVQEVWRHIFKDRKERLSLLYDVAHNIAKVETHLVNGRKKKLIIHRKGAIRSFGPGHPELSETYRETGQPVIIPGSMGTASYVLAGTSEGMQEAYGSCCHGAGRSMSRSGAKKKFSGHRLQEELLKKGIHVQAGSVSGIAEEAPGAYKDVDEVVNIVSEAGIARKVVRLRPLVVIKG